MRFFSKRQQQDLNQYALPGDIASKMERFGRFEFDPQGSSGEMGDFGNLMIELYSFASAEPEGFLVALAEAVLPFSGWAGYGASRTVWEVLSPGRGSPLREHAAYISIMNAAIQFLRANGVPPKNIRPYEWEYWLDSGGTIDTWLPRRRTPSQDMAPITELRPDETRRVVQITSQPDSNVILVRQKDDGRYCAVINARKSNEDPTRAQWEWKSAESLYDLYIEIGLSMQTPTYWYDNELEPYFPLWSRFS